MGLHDILRLEPHGADTYVGTGPRYPWGGLYGGQIVAQALRAAATTVEDGVRPHSLRAYFIRAGDETEPVRYEVDRLRDGRSFTTRRIVARQAVGAILNLEASFTGGEESLGRQRLDLPDVPSPDELESGGWTDLFDRRMVPPELGSGEVHVWLRLVEDTGTDEAAFGFLSDDVPSESIRCLLTDPDGAMEDVDGQWFMVSLDHNVWFHEPIRADRWHLHSFTCDRFVGGRGLTAGQVHDEEGRHVASIAQEMLVRRRRPTQRSR